MGSSLEPHGPNDLLTLDLAYLSFWVCRSSETFRQGTQTPPLRIRGRGQEGGLEESCICHLAPCWFFFFFSQLLIHYWHLPSNQRAAIGCQTRACHSPQVLFQHRLLRACRRCRCRPRSHSCLPCNSLSLPHIPHGIRLDLGHVSSV